MEALDPLSPLPELSPAAWRPDSPRHSPAWRWLRARWLHEMRKRVSSHFDDTMVVAARDFLAREAGTVPARRRRRPPVPDPAIGVALALARDPEPLRRGELEAYLLTDMPFVEVGRRLDLSDVVVSTYHDLFFSVRDCPFSRDWILLRAVGCGPWNDFAGPHPVGVWKYAAVSGGPLILELMIAITADRAFPAWIRQTCGQHADAYEARMRLLGRTTVALMIARCQSHIEKLIAIRAKLDRLDEQKSGRTGATTRRLKLMVRFLRMAERSQASPRRPARTASATRPPRPDTATAPLETVAGSLDK